MFNFNHKEIIWLIQLRPYLSKNGNVIKEKKKKRWEIVLEQRERKKWKTLEFPGGSVVKNLPSDAGDCRRAL